MKRNTLLLYTLISIAFVLGSFDCKQIQNKNKANDSKKETRISPNISDVKNMVKAYVQGPYNPIEVNNLQESKASEPEMAKAEIIGQTVDQSGLIEKPTIYEAVITPHATSIRHSNEQKVQSKTKENSASHNNEAEKMGVGNLHIPIKINTESIVSDPSLANYETPLFLPKKQEKTSENYDQPKKVISSIVNTINEDAKTVKTHLEAAKTLEQKRGALKSEKKRLMQESQKIAKEIQEQVASLVKAKSIGQKLDKLLNLYQVKMKKEKLAKIKLVDRVEIKKQLKEKLLKEAEGFRIAGNQYTKVDQINPEDLGKILEKVESKLGN